MNCVFQKIQTSRPLYRIITVVLEAAFSYWLFSTSVPNDLLTFYRLFVAAYCEPVQRIDNGEVQVESYGYYATEVLRITCNAGFELKGKPNVLCTYSRGWTEFGVCVPKGMFLWTISIVIAYQLNVNFLQDKAPWLIFISTRFQA